MRGLLESRRGVVIVPGKGGLEYLGGVVRVPESGLK